MKNHATLGPSFVGPCCPDRVVLQRAIEAGRSTTSERREWQKTHTERKGEREGDI